MSDRVCFWFISEVQMHLVRKPVAFLAIALFLIAANSLVYAQGDVTKGYENNLFSVEVPDFLDIQAEGSDFVTFAADEAEIDVRLLRPSQTVIDTLGEQAADTLLGTMQFVFFNTDYAIETCPESVAYPCVWFSDSVGPNVLQRALLHDAADDVFFALTFQAPTQDQLDVLNPDAVLGSFQLPGATAELSPADDREALFNVVVNGNVNVRSCASTTCSIVGQATNGQVLPVLAEDGDWYEVQWESGTAFIASWLTTRGPDVYVDLTEGYLDPITGCSLFLRKNRGDTDLYLAISGERHSDVWVDVYRPNDTAPLDVAAQYDKTFIDTEEVYIQQTYYWGTWWPSGTYRVELTLDGKSSLIGFDFENGVEHLIYVYCD